MTRTFCANMCPSAAAQSFSSAVYHYHWPLAEDVASAVAICFCCCLKLSLLYRVQALCAQESCGFFFRTSCHGMSSDTFNHAFCRCLCFLFPFTSSLFRSIPQSLIWEFCMSQLVIHNIYIYTISDETAKTKWESRINTIITAMHLTSEASRFPCYPHDDRDGPFVLHDLWTISARLR